jgi:hypothetical protein
VRAASVDSASEAGAGGGDDPDGAEAPRETGVRIGGELRHVGTPSLVVFVGGRAGRVQMLARAMWRGPVN